MKDRLRSPQKSFAAVSGFVRECNPMTSESLQDLLLRSPNKKELRELYHEINTGTDRSAVIVTGIFVENALREAITARLHRLTKKQLSQLFEGTAPLTSFSSKIRIGYALGVFENQARDNLDLIRRIRNAFAHARRPISFRSHQVIALSNSMSHAAIWKKNPTLINKPPHEQAKGVYSYTAMLLYVALKVAAKKDKRRKVRKPAIRALANDWST